MNVREARSIARQWVADQVADAPGELLGAFTWGSINWMAEEARLPASADVDIAVVVRELDPGRHRVAKRPYRGLAVEPCYVPRQRFASAEAVLGDYALAPNLVHGQVLLDPECLLERLRASVAPEYPRRQWIRRRCRQKRDEGVQFAGWGEASDSFLFAAAVAFQAVHQLAQMVLIADLRNPTVKKALLAAREVLSAYGLERGHQELLALAGAADLGRDALLAAAGRCRRALDLACRWKRTPFGPDNHVNEHARATLEVDVPACVAAGTGRELAAWVGFLHSISMMALRNDAPAEVEAGAWYGYLDDMATLGVATMEEARARVAACRRAFDRFTAVCDGIVDRNPRALD